MSDIWRTTAGCPATGCWGCDFIVHRIYEIFVGVVNEIFASPYSAKFSMIPFMAVSTSTLAPHRLRALCKRHEIAHIDIARDLGLSYSSVAYYFSKKYKKRYLPLDEPWSLDFRSSLVARGCTPEEAGELFGLQQAQDIHTLQASVRHLENQIDEMKGMLVEIATALRINGT